MGYGLYLLDTPGTVGVHASDLVIDIVVEVGCALAEWANWWEVKAIVGVVGDAVVGNSWNTTILKLATINSKALVEAKSDISSNRQC